MSQITISLGNRSYDILIEAGLIARAGEHLAGLAKGRPLAVITDHHVADTLLPAFLNALAASGVRAEAIILPAGEGTKSWAELEALLDRLLELGVERGDHLVALGGGVIGDLVGFAASILKRGCHFVQVPTTLLAQVDSSVGGKTAINTRAGKNLIGTFYQPALVLIDPEALATLPIRELRAGYAEIVKYGLIDDAEFFAWCEAHGPELIAGDAGARLYAIEKSVRAKARIVAADERETSGLRALLNLGHTFGHALEAETGFSDQLLHGEAVAIGLWLAFAFSEAEGLCPPGAADRIAAHLKSVGMHHHPRDAGLKCDGKALVVHMAQDKKMEGGRLAFVLARGIGEAFLAKNVDLWKVGNFLGTVMAGKR